VSEKRRYELAVLIATHNRRSLLGRCLAALAAQGVDPERFEVIVADDGSEEGTGEMLERLQTPYRLRALRLEKRGKAAALNAALHEARAQACLFIDDDVIAAPGLIDAHLAARRRSPEALVLGRIVQRPPRRRDPYAEAAAVRWNRRFEELSEREADWADCYGANFSAPLDSLLEIGGFAEDMPAVEDLEIGFRLTRAGCGVVYAPAAEALHDDEKPGSLILDHEQRYGAWCVRFCAEQPSARGRLLGWFAESTPREAALRRALLGLRVPPAALMRAGRAIPRSRRQLWFDFVSRYAFWHGVQGASDRERWRQTIGGVPVLMYHAFSTDGERQRYVLRRRSFARQMLLLRALRYRVLDFEQLAASLREGRSLPRRAVAITIDDGYRDNFEIAYPILRRHNFTATLFLVSRRLGARADWGSDGGATDGRPLLSLDQVREMRSGGLAIGAHSRTHPSLPALTDAEVLEEVAGSGRDLEEALGEPVATFAYPYGEHDERAVAAARRAPFDGACTTFPRHARFGDDPLRVPRIEVWGTDSTLRFLRKLWLGGQ
jgi:peptidoglycan/xylan/chitin deacetylase (PgdA/CDA1 family)/GT2 family glycosyltransferase